MTEHDTIILSPEQRILQLEKENTIFRQRLNTIGTDINEIMDQLKDLHKDIDTTKSAVKCHLRALGIDGFEF